MSYLIPTEEITLAEQYRMRKTAIEMGRARARILWNMADGNLTERDADYTNDFILPNSPAAVATAGWLSMPLNVIGTWYNVFADSTPAAVTPVVPTNQVWVFYKVANLSLAGPDAVCGLQFRIGTVANLRAQFDMENVNGKVVSDGYFSQPISYESPDVCQALVECRIAIAAAGRIKLGVFIIEPLQATVI